MDALYRPLFPRHQTDALRPIPGCVVVGFPRLPHGRVIVDEAFLRAEDEVAAREYFFQVL